MYYLKISNKLFIFAILCSLILISGCRKPEEEAASPQINAKLVEVIPVKHGSMMKKISFTGNLYSLNEVSVLPRVGGQVAEVYVDEGDEVSEG